jgi:hypothetical protein
MSSSTPYIAPIKRLKLIKNVVPKIFEKGTKTPRFHLTLLDKIEERHRFTAIAIFRGASKSTIVTKAYTATEIFLNKEAYTQIVSKNHDKATGFTRDIKKILLGMQKRGYSVVLGDKTADDYFEVIIDGIHTCVVEAIGAGEDPRGKTADFMRPTLIIVDDLESKQGNYNVAKKKLRDKLASWYDEDLVPGLHPTLGRLIFLGTIIHKDSLINRCMNDDDYKILDVPIIQNGKSSWYTRFPLDVINKIKEAYRKRGKLSSFFREYMNKPVADEKILFKDGYFKYFSHVEFYDESYHVGTRTIKNALESLVIFTKKPRYIVFNDGTKLSLEACTVRTTMDVASGGESGDKSALTTVATDIHGNKYLLEIKSGYWNPFQKGVYSIETYLTWKPLIFGIEEGGMQNDFHSAIEVLQAEEKVYIPVQGLKHGGVNKNVRIGNMQPAFVQGKWWFNASDTNTSVLEAQLNSFDIEADSGDDDEMDALAYHEKYNKYDLCEEEEEEDDNEALYS